MRIGVFGGTFDPVHNIHLDVARAALQHANLDKVLFVVASQPPHKRNGFHATPDQRYEMVELALKDEPKMEPCHLELDRDGPSYTVDTLRELNRQYDGAALNLIMGLDSLVDLPQWKDTEEILDLAHILVVTRPGPKGIPPSLQGRYTVVPFEPIDESSTDVRTLMFEGKPFEDRVPSAVARYIHKHNVYNADSQPSQS